MKDIYVGTFSEDDCRQGIDKAKVEAMKAENPDCKYVKQRLVKNNGAYSLKLWIADFESYSLGDYI